jgi:hypothetical protein
VDRNVVDVLGVLRLPDEVVEGWVARGTVGAVRVGKMLDEHVLFRPVLREGSDGEQAKNQDRESLFHVY